MRLACKLEAVAVIESAAAKTDFWLGVRFQSRCTVKLHELRGSFG